MLNSSLPQHSLATEPNEQVIPAPPVLVKSRSIPATLILLLVLLIVQLSILSTVSVLQIAQGYVGYNWQPPMQISTTQCSNVESIAKYYGKQLQILSIAMTGNIFGFIFSILMLVLVIVSIVYVRKIPINSNVPNKIEIDQMFYVLSNDKRNCMFISQSLTVLGVMLPFGYFLSYWVNAQKSCVWTQFNQN